MDVTKILSVGIDPAKQSHYVVAMVYPEIKLMSKRINNAYEAIAELDKTLSVLSEKQNLTLVYGLEDSGVYGNTVKDFLLERNRLVYEVNPLKTNRQKDFYGQDKSDSIDATACASIVLRLQDKLPALNRKNQLYSAIKEASRFRETLVKNKTQIINRLHAHLTRVFSGAYIEFFPRIFSHQAIDFFIRYPIPESLKDASVKEIAFVLSKASKHRTGPLKRGKSSVIKAACILEKVKFIKDRHMTQQRYMQAQITKQLALTLKQNLAAIKAIEKELTKLVEATDQKLTTFKGISTVLSGVILGETLSPERFNNPNQFALFNGTAPRENSTGGKIRHESNKFCNRRLKRAFHQIALTASWASPISKTFYETSIKRGLSKHQALKRLERRLSDIIFALLKNKSGYEVNIALENMRRRKSPLLKQNEGKMAVSKEKSLVFKSLIENTEPCLTPTDNYSKGKTKNKENHLIFKKGVSPDFRSQKFAKIVSRLNDLDVPIDKCIPKF